MFQILKKWKLPVLFGILIGFAFIGILTINSVSNGPSRFKEANTWFQRIKDWDVDQKHFTNIDSYTPRWSSGAGVIYQEKDECKQADNILHGTSFSLMPINEAVFKSILASNQNGRQGFESKVRSLLPVFLQKGCGLVAMETELGEKGWIENGVVYRPVRLSNITERYPSPHKSEVEAYVPFSSFTFFGRGSEVPVSKKKKMILWWTKTRYAPPMNGLEPMRSCPDFPCVMTSNRNYASDSAAMVFAGQITTGKPPERRPDQIFIYSNHEPPACFPEKPAIFEEGLGWKGVFNWTMTYRLDSDVTSFYGLVRRRRTQIHKNYQTILGNKTKQVAWIVSNCLTAGKREKYVEELSQYIDIDVYGNCGELKCPRNNDLGCLEMVSTSYKFYLSFENAICTDYISEKFFRYLSTNTVVVARASNDFYAHAPPGIFVNTADFDSPKKLAERLLYLAQNEVEYVKILREKDKYVSIFEDYPIRFPNGQIKYMHYHYEAVPFCEICLRLWNLDKYKKTIPDIKKWFDEKLCRDPDDISL